MPAKPTLLEAIRGCVDTLTRIAERGCVFPIPILCIERERPPCPSCDALRALTTLRDASPLAGDEALWITARKLAWQAALDASGNGASTDGYHAYPVDTLRPNL